MSGGLDKYQTILLEIYWQFQLFSGGLVNYKFLSSIVPN